MTVRIAGPSVGLGVVEGRFGVWALGLDEQLPSSLITVGP